MEGGVRTPYILTLDHRMTVLSDIVDRELQSKLVGTLANKALNATEAYLAKNKNIPTTTESFTKPDGSVVITSVSPYDQKVAEFFTLMGPNPFPGTDHIRDDFEREIKRKEEASGGCNGCQRGTVIRKYSVVLKDFLEAQAV